MEAVFVCGEFPRSDIGNVLPYGTADHFAQLGIPSRVPRLDRSRRLAALLHDAPEYVIGDMISPFKAVIGDSYKAVERRLLTAIHLRFGLPAQSPPELEDLIKAADRAAAYLEATRLAGFETAEARRFFGRPPTFSATIERDYLTPAATIDGTERFHNQQQLDAYLEKLQAQMKAAAANLDFEKAASLRDDIKRLRNPELGLPHPARRA